MFSHLKQRHGFLEHKVSHVELRPNSHRRQGLTESKASQRVQHYEQRQGLREGRVSQKARPHRSQGLTEGKASQKPGSHGRPGLAEGKTLEKARCVTHSRDSHNRQGEIDGFRTWRCFHPWNHTLPNCCSPLLLPHANCSCSLSGWRQNDRTGPVTFFHNWSLGFYIWSILGARYNL